MSTFVKNLSATRGLRTAGIVIAVLAILWSAAWFYVPAILKSQVERIATGKLGRDVSLGHVRFNPWTLDLTIDDLAIAGATAAAAPQLEIKRIHADTSIASVLRFAPVLDALEIESPTVRLTRLENGRYDIDDIVRHLPPSKPGSERPRFALHNIVVRNGSADVVDMPVKTTHALRGLELGLPFFSSLPSEVEIKVLPHLAFVLDGSRFDSSAEATPLSERGNGDVTLKLDHFDIAPWLGYLPPSLPVRPKSALVSADLRIAFQQRPTVTLKVSGNVEVTGIAVVDAASNRLLEVGGMKVVIDEVRPLERIAKLARVEVEAPHVLATRDARGRVNLMLAADKGSDGPVPVLRLPLPTTAASAASSAASSASSTVLGAGAAGMPWTLTLAALSVHAGQLDWRDATIAPEAALALREFSLDAQSIAWPLDAPVVFKGGGVLGSDKEHGRLDFSGQGNAAGAKVHLTLDALPLGAARPYVRGLLEPSLAGELSADLVAVWKSTPAGPALQIDARRIALASLLLGNAQTPDIGAEKIELLDAHIDIAAKSASIGRIALVAPRARLERDAARRWSFERWRRSGVAASTSPAASVAAASSPATAIVAMAPSAASAASAAVGKGGWKLALGELAIEKGRFNLLDRAAAAPVVLDFSEVGVQLEHWAFDAPAAAAPFRVAARLGLPADPNGKIAGSGVIGQVDVRGELGGFVAGAPTRAKAAVAMKDMPLHLLGAYLAELPDIDVQKAQTSFKGTVAWESRSAGPSLRVHGDMSVDDFRASNAATRVDGSAGGGLAMVPDAASDRQLLNWKSLSLRDVDVAMAPGTTTRVAVGETSLSDFFARVELGENGRLNLQDVQRGGARPAGAAASAAGSSTPTPTPAPSASLSPSTAAPPIAVAVASPARAASQPAVIVTSGPITLVNGTVVYNDRFVRPNFRANLTELTGSLAAFSSQAVSPGEPPLLADLSLRGRVSGTGLLEITGKVNPLAKPLALDVHAKVRDLELPSLSPYAIKYSGYGIERGKMSVDLAYVVRPDGQLTASNKIVLNQLAFGDKVAGSTASLPVKLAVALLADRHGVIDLDLPVSGSINDPQFSLGGLIWKVITNLIVKAVTAPFSLLASAFGGGGSEQSSSVDFAPGSAAIAPEARDKLDQVAKALIDRPALTLTVTGESRMESDREAWKQERLKQLVRAEKRREAIGGGASATAEVVVSDADYPVLLKEVYKRAEIAKPKNVLGFAKDVPASDMESLLLASIVVGDDAMRQLATRRGVAVRDYLATRELPTSRLFLGAPRTAPEGDKWTPRADLKLTTQ